MQKYSESSRKAERNFQELSAALLEEVGATSRLVVGIVVVVGVMVVGIVVVLLK